MQEERIKNLISRSENILIVPAHPNEPESFNASLALASILNNMGKNANVAQNNTLPSGGDSEYKAHITIDTQGREISQIYYEKEKDSLNIFIDYKNTPLCHEDISITNDQKPASYDLIFTIGVENLATLDEFTEENFKLFYERPIINISNILSTETFGQINIIEDSPLSQLIASTALPFGKKLFTSEVKDLLQQSASAYLQKSGNHQKLVSILEFLANTDLASEPICKTPIASAPHLPPNNIARLIARAMERMEIDLRSNIPFFFIDDNDFADTGTNIKDVALIASHIKQNQRLQFPGFAIVWQKPNNKNTFDALLYFKDQEKTKDVWRLVGGESRGGALLCSVNAENSDQAKIQITNIL
jgi:hypothetical protein